MADLKNMQGAVYSPVFDLSKQYAQYSNVLEGAKEGEVVTRFPPEPSGYLHIGHVKAALLNYHYAKIYKGKMLLRFDDTNPLKEKDEFVESIMEDLATLQVIPASVSYTSDHFDHIQKQCEKLIKEGKAYCDDTPVEKMREERNKGIESARRNATPEENMKIWEQMVKGETDKFCVRAKMDMQALNKCLRDPVMYRTVKEPHHRTGTKYNVYPTYDFACPIVDALEGVTHTLRTNEYHDRNDQFFWFIEALGLRKPIIYDYSRLNLVNTCLSKRKLQWFVDDKRVEGWHDPRFPTIRGIMRRGLRVETLIEFMLEQGPSKNCNLMEWDKLWAINKKIIDPISGRYTAISKEKTCHLTITNIPNKLEVCMVPVHQPNPALGERPLYRYNLILLDHEDAKEIKEGDKITLMKWGNVKVTKVEANGESFNLTGEYQEGDADFKSTRKVTWLPNEPSILSKVTLVEFDHLLNAKKVEEDVDFKTILNEQTRFTTDVWADPMVKTLQKSTIIQFERRGYFIVDKILKGEDGSFTHEMIYIPDGKTKGMGLATKVDQSKLAKGGAGKEEETKGEAAGEGKKKDKKKEKKEGEESKEGEKKEGEQKEGEAKPEKKKKEAISPEEAEARKKAAMEAKKAKAAEPKKE